MRCGTAGAMELFRSQGNRLIRDARLLIAAPETPAAARPHAMAD